MNSKIIVAAVVVVIIVAAAGSAVFLMNDDEKDYEYDPAKGWYSWDPITLETKTAYFSITPLLTTGTELMYKSIYGGEPNYAKYSLSLTYPTISSRMTVL